MKAVVLAAGEGTRLRPLTADRPKALVEVAGDPILTHCLENLAALRIEEVIVVVGYAPPTLESTMATRSTASRSPTSTRRNSSGSPTRYWLPASTSLAPSSRCTAITSSGRVATSNG